MKVGGGLGGVLGAAGRVVAGGTLVPALAGGAVGGLMGGLGVAGLGMDSPLWVGAFGRVWRGTARGRGRGTLPARRGGASPSPLKSAQQVRGRGQPVHFSRW